MDADCNTKWIKYLFNYSNVSRVIKRWHTPSLCQSTNIYKGHLFTILKFFLGPTHLGEYDSGLNYHCLLDYDAHLNSAYHSYY